MKNKKFILSYIWSSKNHVFYCKSDICWLKIIRIRRKKKKIVNNKRRQVWSLLVECWRRRHLCLLNFIKPKRGHDLFLPRNYRIALYPHRVWWSSSFSIDRKFQTLLHLDTKMMIVLHLHWKFEILLHPKLVYCWFTVYKLNLIIL